MTKRSNNFIKRLVIDVAGCGLLLAAAAFSWVPGPGGIPLLIAGLSLLSINHKWAKRWLKKAKESGLNLTDKIFSDHPVAKWTLDIIGVAMLILALYIVNTYTRNIARSVAISATFLGLSLLLGNRKRLKHFMSWIQHKK